MFLRIILAFPTFFACPAPSAINALPPAAPVDDQLLFIMESAAEKSQIGRIVSLAPDFTLILQTGSSESSIPGVLRLRRRNHPLPPPPTGPQLITGLGDRIAGALVGGDANNLKFLPKFLDRGGVHKAETAWKAPLSCAAVLWLTPTPADTPADPSRYAWLAGSRNRDLVRFRNGDLARGTISGVAGDGAEAQFLFRPDQGSERKLNSEEVSAVAFNPALTRTRKPKGPYVRVVLADSSRIHLTAPTIAGDRLTGATLFGEKAAIPLKDVLSLDVLLGRSVSLTDLKPHSVEQTGYLGVVWPWTADRSVRGTPLRVSTADGESTFDQGIGTHPRTVLTFDLSGKYQRFEALVGMDPSAPIRGRAKVQIRVDGKERNITGLAELDSGNAVPVELDVRGAKELTLATDFSSAGGVGADVNWCDARLIE
jgi:hypothetical protein